MHFLDVYCWVFHWIEVLYVSFRLSSSCRPFTVIPEGVEVAEDLSLLKDKRSTDLNMFLVTQLTDAFSRCVLLGVSLD